MYSFYAYKMELKFTLEKQNKTKNNKVNKILVILISFSSIEGDLRMVCMDRA